MSRVIKIEKVGKTTIVEIINDGQQSPEVFALNKLTNVTLRNNVLQIPTQEQIVLHVQYGEIFDKLSSTDLKDYLHKASALFLFNQ